MKHNIIIIFFLNTFLIYGQNFSFGFNYSGLLTGKNYESVSFYALEVEYAFIPNTLSAGFLASASDTRINKLFIKYSPPVNPYEGSLKMGVQAKYFPFLLKEDSFTFKPYIGIELGISLQGFQTYFNMPSNCFELYFFERNKSFFTNFILGGIIYPEQPLNVIFGLKYQISNPTIKYKQPICSEEGWGEDGEIWHSEKVNLNVLVWNVGVRFNF